MRNLFRAFAFASLAALLMTGIAVTTARSALAQSQSQTQNEDRKSVTGTLTSIDSDSFSLEVKDKDQTRNMDFYLDKTTKIDGNVGVGDTVVVEYRATDYGANIALRVTPHKS